MKVKETTSYSVLFDNSYMPALYKGKGSDEDTEYLDNMRTYKSINGVFKLLSDKHIYWEEMYLRTGGIIKFEEPRIIIIKVEQIGDMFPIVVETTYDVLTPQQTYNLYKTWMSSERVKWIKKNPEHANTEFEELPKSVEYFKTLR